MGSEKSKNSSLDLVAATAHELKTPLTLIHGMSSMLESGTFGSLNLKQKEQLRHISRAGKRLNFLIESLIHVDGLHRIGQLQPVQLQTELQAVIAALATNAAEKDIVVNYQPRSLPPVLADPASIYQMLMHILGTSIRYAPEGSAINMRAYRRGEKAVIHIKDAGLGVLPGEVRMIKNSFGTRRQPVKAHSDSTGLGLYLIQSIVEFYGGSLHSSPLKEGSSLTVKLPISNQLSLF